MKVYEILKKENINKKFKDNKGQIWKVTLFMENLILILANPGSSGVSIVNFYYLDEIFELEFVEINYEEVEEEIIYPGFEGEEDYS